MSRIIVIFFIFSGSYAIAQTDPSQVQRALLDESHWSSPRAAAMANAVSPIASGLDSSYFNPAGLGGLWDKEKKPSLHRLYIPYLAASMNKDSIQLNEDLSQAGDLEDPAIIDQILRSYQDKRQYGRFSAVPSISFWRMQLAYVYDTQFAAAATDSVSDQVDMESRTISGPSLGFSFATPSKSFSLGIYSAYFKREEVQTTLPFTTINDPDLRKSAIGDAKQTYEGMPIHVGMRWTLADRWHPTLAVVARNAGGSKYRNQDKQMEDLVVEEDLTLGFSVSPRLGKWAYLHWVVEAFKLSDNATATSKKLRTGMELSLGDRIGGDSGFSLRAGYSNAGLSYGFGTNLGLLGINLASFAEDVGVNNQRVIEQRFVVNFAVNVADY